MYLKLTRITKDAYFDTDSAAWRNGATTKEIYRPMETTPVLVNCTHLAVVRPSTYRDGMSTGTPARHAGYKFLIERVGSLVIMSTKANYDVTETFEEIEALIGTQYTIEQA